jgi:5-methylcytosine-specific restriction endonuclease McrBC GTP-binding regulatory subunit McrB
MTVRILDLNPNDVRPFDRLSEGELVISMTFPDCIAEVAVPGDEYERSHMFNSDLSPRYPDAHFEMHTVDLWKQGKGGTVRVAREVLGPITSHDKIVGGTNPHGFGP